MKFVKVVHNKNILNSYSFNKNSFWKEHDPYKRSFYYIFKKNNYILINSNFLFLVL